MTDSFDRATARELDRSDWSGYFQELTRQLAAGLELDAQIEVAGAVVDGTEAGMLPLVSVTYERGDDQVAIGLGGRDARHPAVLWHYVDRPARAWVHEHNGIPTAIGIEAADGTYTFLRLRATARAGGPGPRRRGGIGGSRSSRLGA